MKYNTYREHHAPVFDFALGPHVETERAVLVLFVGVVPSPAAHAHLEGHKLVDHRPHLLVAFFDGVVLVLSVLNARGVAAEFKVERNEVATLDRVQH